MNRFRLRNRYLKSPSLFTWQAYESQRIACTKLFRLRKREYFNKLNIKLISDKKNILEGYIKPFFSDKQICSFHILCCSTVFLSFITKNRYFDPFCSPKGEFIDHNQNSVGVLPLDYLQIPGISKVCEKMYVKNI